MNAAVAFDATAAAGSTAGSMVSTFVTFGLIILIFYFLMIRPQKKKDKETKAMLDAMKKGDKVVSIGGIHGTVIAVRESTVIVKVDDNTRMEFSRSAISQVVDSTKAKADAKAKTEKKSDEKVEKVDAPQETTEAAAPEKTAETTEQPKKN
jgi:preprotein translocase subunit YajC